LLNEVDTSTGSPLCANRRTTAPSASRDSEKPWYVEKRDQPGAAHGVEHLRPLLLGQVVPGGVVAAGMQHHDGAGRGRRQVGEHALDVDTVDLGVEVAVGLDGEAGPGEQGLVILPGRVRDQHLCARVELPQEVGPDLERTGAAERLDGAHPLQQGGIGAERQLLDRSVVRPESVDGQVATRRRVLGDALLGLPDALQQRQLALGVLVDAHPQVDLVRIGVGDEGLGETQNGVAGGKRHCCEDR
jgi:hypothetical protein